jgi:hypothetical protein
MDGDQERHGLFRARPLPSGGSACPSARISIPQVIPMVYDAACEVHHEHFSRTADKRVKDLNPISNYWTGPAWMVGLVIGSETA